jgi:putative ABC transport system permease protein
MAIGAGRGRLVRQFLVESLVLALLGGGLGLLGVFWATRALAGTLAVALPRASEIRPDVAVAAFTMLIAAVTGVLFGLAPALATSRTQVADALKRDQRTGISGGRNTRRALVIAEVALALVLLIGASLLLRSFSRLRHVDLGFHPEHALTFQISLPFTTPQAVFNGFYGRVIERLSALPDVQAAGMIDFLPFAGSSTPLEVAVEGATHGSVEQRIMAEGHAVSGGYFTAMGIPLLEGRTFTARDKPGSPPVAIVNRKFARLFFPDESAIAKRIRNGRTSREIVGVVDDAKYSGLAEDILPVVFSCYEQGYWPQMNFIVRTAGDPLSVAGAIRGEVRSIDPRQAVASIKTMEQRMAEVVARPRFQTLLLGSFAALALLLASIGIYGVVSYTIAARTREIGIRMALGARPSDILRNVLGQGLAMALAGVAAGLALAAAAARAMGGLLFQVRALDPATFLTVPLVLLAIAALACYVPARRAMGLDPVIALRDE